MSNSLPGKHLLQLAEKWRNGTITEDELKELEEWYRQNQDRPVEIPQDFAASEQEHSERILKAIKEKAGIQAVETPSAKSSSTIAIRFSRYYRYAAAALVLVVATTVFYVLNTGKPEAAAPQPHIVKTPEVITPPKQGAILTLVDGRQIVLDSVTGNIAHEGGASVVNKAGSIIYGASKNNIPEAEIVYNTISTPNGRQYQLTLQDGSKVWLNAGSSIRFPAVFTGKDRAVEITGEVYFEVAPDHAKPFIVSVNDMQVEVLGTHFNINSYNDEGYTKTTLLEGKVRVTNSENAAVLKPGQQAEVGQSAHHSIKVRNDVDLEEVMAWKNGVFRFHNSNITSIMKQVERWYDVEVIYEVPTEDLDFSGYVGKKENVTELLKIMELTGLVHFKIDGRTITVVK